MDEFLSFAMAVGATWAAFELAQAVFVAVAVSLASAEFVVGHPADESPSSCGPALSSSSSSSAPSFCGGGSSGPEACSSCGPFVPQNGVVSSRIASFPVRNFSLAFRHGICMMLKVAAHAEVHSAPSTTAVAAVTTHVAIGLMTVESSCALAVAVAVTSARTESVAFPVAVGEVSLVGRPR